MASSAEGRQPELRHKVLAAAGASVFSAVLVNPLDVIKTRIQATSIVTDRPLPTCQLTRYPVRWVRQPSITDCSLALPGSATSSCTGAAGPPLPPAGSVSGVHRPVLSQLPMSSCACALQVAELGPMSRHSNPHCQSARPYHPVTATAVLRDIVRKEGWMTLWRGTDTAILAAVPMVGVYMPLYDYLLERTAPAMRPTYAPVVAGSAARTLAVLLVGPLELIRTRQQGSALGATTAWGALRDTLRDTLAQSPAAAGARARGGSGEGAGDGGGSRAGGAAAASPAGPARGGVATLGVLRGLPRLWTGVVATLARDVPFSALYWGLVENIRGRLLAQWGAQRQAGGQAGASPSGHEQQPGAVRGPAAAPGPSGRAVLLANLLAGSAAGAVAAVATTPFDVVKTQLQLQMGASDAREGWQSGSVDVARRIWAREGAVGLFRGWVPRAARTAPACAVVVASYEVLKLLL